MAKFEILLCKFSIEKNQLCFDIDERLESQFVSLFFVSTIYNNNRIRKKCASHKLNYNLHSHGIVNIS